MWQLWKCHTVGKCTLKMDKEKELKIEAIFDSANYGKVSCKIKINDGVALAVFSDRRLAKDMYWAEKQLGIDDVYFKERLSALATKYPGKTKETIAKLLIMKLRKHNVEITRRTSEAKNDYG